MALQRGYQQRADDIFSLRGAVCCEVSTEWSRDQNVWIDTAGCKFHRESACIILRFLKKACIPNPSSIFYCKEGNSTRILNIQCTTAFKQTNSKNTHTQKPQNTNAKMPKPNISQNKGPQPKVVLYEKSTKKPEA